MSIWSKFLDWILGREIMSIEDLKTIEDTAITSLESMFENLNEKIDTDENGMVSIREAWVLMKDSVAWARSIIKELLKCPTIKR